MEATQAKTKKEPQYIILGVGEEINVVVEMNHPTFRPLILKSGELYDPANDFRPLNPRFRQKSLSVPLQQKAVELIASAAEKWVAPVTEAPKEKAQDAAAPVTPPLTTPQATLDVLIAKSVAELSVDSVLQVAQPLIDKFIRDTYGLIPKVMEVKTGFGTHKVEGLTHNKFETILKLVNADIPVFLTGPAGCGKNVLCKQIADALGKEFYFSNAVTQEYKLTGFIDANGHYHETQFFKAFTEGGVFMLDEIDASTPEVLVILNAAIANRYFDFPTGRVEAHKDFRLVAAGNTYGTGADIEYTGRYQLDAASLDRFAIIEITYDKGIEEAIAGGDKELIEFVRYVRKAIHEAKIKFIVSYRSIDRLAKLKNIFSKSEAIKIALVRGLDKEDAQVIARNLPNSSNEYVNEFKRTI